MQCFAAAGIPLANLLSQTATNKIISSSVYLGIINTHLTSAQAARRYTN
jgi:hypothetical protein